MAMFNDKTSADVNPHNVSCLSDKSAVQYSSFTGCLKT